MHTGAEHPVGVFGDDLVQTAAPADLRRVGGVPNHISAAGLSLFGSPHIRGMCQVEPRRSRG